MNIDRCQGLGDFIMQFTTDRFALLFLREEYLVVQLPQLLLHLVGLFQQEVLFLFTPF